jgi:hypothetical protein
VLAGWLLREHQVPACYSITRKLESEIEKRFKFLFSASFFLLNHSVAVKFPLFSQKNKSNLFQQSSTD